LVGGHRCDLKLYNLRRVLGGLGYPPPASSQLYKLECCKVLGAVGSLIR
jgi:hypothetical protein